jgi:predicted RNA binding protein YcfA (HicA-like mRNA interferase family)
MPDEDLFRRICEQQPVEARLRDVCRLLENQGWRREAGGKHPVQYSKPGQRRLVIATDSGRMVKRYILKQVCDRLETDG